MLGGGEVAGLGVRGADTSTAGRPSAVEQLLGGDSATRPAARDTAKAAAKAGAPAAGKDTAKPAAPAADSGAVAGAS